MTCNSCGLGFDDKERIPVLLSSCDHKICKLCCEQLKSGDDELECLVCERVGKIIIEKSNRHLWIMKQGHKKRIILKKEIASLEKKKERNLMELNKEFSHHSHNSLEEEKKESIVFQRKNRDNFGLISDKFLRNARMSMIRPTLKFSNQREVNCKFCDRIFNNYNRPLIMEQCACGEIHQVCEYCF